MHLLELQKAYPTSEFIMYCSNKLWPYAAFLASRLATVVSE